MKQPHEKKQDYRKSKEIIEEIEHFVDRSPHKEIMASGEVKIIRRAISFDAEREELRDSATEMLGVLKDNMKDTKTQTSKQKNIQIQEELRNAKKKLE